MTKTAIQPVILCGGSGSRLWPLSRSAMPKPFISLGVTGSKTLFQQTALRVNGEGFLPPVVICAEAHRFYVIAQLAEIGITPAAIILEPTARNTAAAIALATAWAKEAKVEAPLALLPADHLMGAPAEFQRALTKAAERADERIVLFGITPTFANTEYGYIRFGQPTEGAYEVEAFLEKPNRKAAEEMLAAGNHVWNSGIFTATAKRLEAEFAAHSPEIAKATDAAWAERSLQDVMGTSVFMPGKGFAEVPSAQFDTAVMEKTKNALVMPYNGRWSDIGGFSALAEAMEQDSTGNSVFSSNGAHVMAPDTTGTLIHASGRSKVVAVHGMSDAVIVDTPDALLVTTKSRAAGVKAVFAMLQEQQMPHAELPQRVHRPWGWYETIAAGPGFLVKRIGVVPGGRLSLQYHHHRSEHWVVTTGTATVTKGEDTLTLTPDQSVYLPLGIHHRLENLTDEAVEIVEVQIGNILEESDIVRVEDIYSRA